MSLTQLLNQTCWLITRTETGTTDLYGNEVPDEDIVATVCEVQQRRRTEDPAEGEVSESDWLGVFPVDTDLTTADAVSVEGIGTFELVGDPWPARNPRTQAASHVEVTLRRVAGAEDGS